jgi:hypothetical protein
MSSVGGFVGADALLALATLQQSNWNEQMSTEMRLAQLQSDMASDLASIKSHLETANQNPARFPALDEEIDAFIQKYGNVPELEGVVSVVREIDGALGRQLAALPANQTVVAQPHAQYLAAGRGYVAGLHPGSSGQSSVESTSQPSGGGSVEKFEQRQVDNWLERLTESLDACSINDQLRMIHIKQLNDNINNNSGMVSGIIESRNNATSSIINNLA